MIEVVVFTLWYNPEITCECFHIFVIVLNITYILMW